MNSFTRTIMSGPSAFVVTTGLALIMAKMIHVPYVTLPDKPEKMSFTINPEIIKETPIKKRKAVLIRVTPPPAPPIIDIQEPTAPSEPIADKYIVEPTYDKLTLDPQTVTLVIVDKDEQPILRFEPVMPPRAQRSGHCKVRFNLTAQGQPYDVVTTYCSQAIFKRPTIKAVQKWQYNPKILDGVAVSRHGVETFVRFNLLDERGFLIPE